MTKIYNGGNTWHLIRISGEVLDLTDDEINEIAEESPLVERVREERDYAKNEYARALGHAGDACSEIDELYSYITSEREDVNLDEVLRLAHMIKCTVERI